MSELYPIEAAQHYCSEPQVDDESEPEAAAECKGPTHG
jgi:hypothetical protein